jgi:hypothetical protein
MKADSRRLPALALQHGAEHRAGGKLGSGEPQLHGLDRTEATAAQDGHLGPLPSWSVLRRRIATAQAVRRLGKILHLQRHQLGAAERAGEAQRQQRVSGQSASICFSTSAVAGALPSLAAPMVRRIPRRTALTPSWLVGGSWPAILCR